MSVKPRLAAYEGGFCRAEAAAGGFRAVRFACEADTKPPDSKWARQFPGTRPDRRDDARKFVLAEEHVSATGSLQQLSYHMC